MPKKLLFLLFAISLFAECSDGPDIDEFINILNVSDDVLMILLGVDYYEAVTAIKTTEGIVVIDAGTSPTLTKKYRGIIEKEFDSKNIIYLINTHAHSDHTGGNQVFSDAEIIAHETCRAEMEEYWQNQADIIDRCKNVAGQLNMELDTLQTGTAEWDQVFCNRYRYSSALHDMQNGFVVTLPTQTFTEDKTITLGDKTFELIYFGNAHSKSDILIYIPEEKMLFVGDLFFNGGRPSLSKYEPEDIERWNKILAVLINKDIDTVIQGHGLILDKDDVEKYYANIKNLVQ